MINKPRKLPKTKSFPPAAGLVFLFTALVLPLCLAGDETTINPLFPVRLEHEFSRPQEIFEDVKQLILKHYYSEDITEEVLYWAGIKGMLRHISPPKNPELSQIWTADEYAKILDTLQGVKISLGIKSSFNPGEGSLTVTEVLVGSSAESILRPFDRILRIDSEPLKGKSLRELNALLEGEAETEVKLTVNRDIKTFDVILKRRKLETKTLAVTRLTDKIALVEIKHFTAGLFQKLKDALEKLRKEEFQGLIIDLRNNTGGVFGESLRIVELFLPEKRILLRTYQRETRLQNYVSVNKEPFEFDIAILVNRKTASSAEILASALQDNQKAFIVGTRTFGKGVFEKTFTLENHFRVKFITGAMYSPKGRSWQTTGITPDFLVEQDEKTISNLFKMEPKQRLNKDVSMITAYKLLIR